MKALQQFSRRFALQVKRYIDQTVVPPLQAAVKAAEDHAGRLEQQVAEAEQRRADQAELWRKELEIRDTKLVSLTERLERDGQHAAEHRRLVESHGADIREYIKSLPMPKDGKDGRDGITEDRLQATVRDLLDGVVAARLTQIQDDAGAMVRQRLSQMVMKGIWRTGESYQESNMVQFGGSVWYCNTDTSDKPGTTNAWTLMVRKGRDGRDRPDRPGLTC